MRLQTIAILIFSLALMSGVPAAAQAVPMDNFTITYLNYSFAGDTEVYTFSLPANTAPDCVNCVAPGSFTFDNVAYNVDGNDPTLEGPGTDTEIFFTTGYQNTYNPDYSFDNAFGGVVAFPVAQQYFSGDVSNPTFTPGLYSFTYTDGESAPDGTILITPAGVAAAGGAQTPEPSSLLLLSTGLLGIVGTAQRRFRRSSKTTLA